MSFYRIIKDKNNPYVMMNKYALEDEKISWKAKGILAYLLSLPDDWKIYESELQNHAKDGKDSLAAGIKELEQAGYIKKSKIRNLKGQITGTNYEVYEVPTETGKTDIGKTVSGKPDSGKTATTNNNLSKKESNNIYISPKGNEIACSFWKIYLREYQDYFCKNHPRIKKEQMSYIECSLMAISDSGISEEEFQSKVIEYFDSLRLHNNGNILAFLKASKRLFDVDLDRAI